MAFDAEQYRRSITPVIIDNPEHARPNLRSLRALSLFADTCIDMYAGHMIPSAEVSMELLRFCYDLNDAIGWLATKITIDDDIGCWCLPLDAEYDSGLTKDFRKPRARYAQVSNAQFDAHSELAHRFVIRRLFGVELVRADHWDHLCRTHACCNPTHGELVTAQTNNSRKDAAARHVPGMDPLF